MGLLKDSRQREHQKLHSLQDPGAIQLRVYLVPSLPPFQVALVSSFWDCSKCLFLLLPLLLTKHTDLEVWGLHVLDSSSQQTNQCLPDAKASVSQKRNGWGLLQSSAHSWADKLQLGELGSGTGNVVIGTHKDRCDVQEEVVFLCWAVKWHDFYSPE